MAPGTWQQLGAWKACIYRHPTQEDLWVPVGRLACAWIGGSPEAGVQPPQGCGQDQRVRDKGEKRWGRVPEGLSQRPGGATFYSWGGTDESRSLATGGPASQGQNPGRRARRRCGQRTAVWKPGGRGVLR